MRLSSTKLFYGLYSPVLYTNPSFPEFNQSLGKLHSLAKDLILIHKLSSSEEHQFSYLFLGRKNINENVLNQLL